MGDTISKASVSDERIQEVLDTVSSFVICPRAPCAAFKGAIEFDRVCFQLRPDRPILKTRFPD